MTKLCTLIIFPKALLATYPYCVLHLQTCREHCISCPADCFNSHLLLCDSFLKKKKKIYAILSAFFFFFWCSMEDCVSSLLFVFSFSSRKIATTNREGWLWFTPVVSGHRQMFFPHLNNTREERQESVLWLFLRITLPLLFQLLKGIDGSANQLSVNYMSTQKKRSNIRMAICGYIVWAKNSLFLFVFSPEVFWCILNN